ENSDRLVARLQVALHGTLMERPDNSERQLDVMLEFSTAVLSQALPGLLFLLLCKLLQLVDSDTAEQNRQQQDGPEGQQKKFRPKSQIEQHFLSSWTWSRDGLKATISQSRLSLSAGSTAYLPRRTKNPCQMQEACQT